MDEHHVAMLLSAIERGNETCDRIDRKLEEHIGKDEDYWKRIDQQEGQLSLIKWLCGSISVSGLLAWLFGSFGKH